ncbi:MAG: haloacid dehalogenase-like hydrolase [Syntrophorhabdaceae bacterium PtaU1.Bin034]|jgi:P-type E1-E2 ATPase|nr:MAG: haloacid dehalogenase-like hydrolase [Syntrophorhabdaceae bacterium PtaU1.Bin034]
MISVPIPGWGELSIEYLMVDFNGTVALDGKLKKEVRDVIEKVSRYIKVFIITADTYDTVDSELASSNVTFIKVNKNESGEEKAKVVRELGPEKIVAIGNGANDAAMLKEAALGIAVMGEEGCAATLIKEADVVVTDIMKAFGLIVHPERLVATLRD